MPNMILPTPWKTYIKFDQTEYYFFYFDEQGITIYSTGGNNYAIIPWNEVVTLNISHIAILGKIIIKTKDNNTYKFQINRFAIGCPWIKRNTKYLEDNNYFYNN